MSLTTSTHDIDIKFSGVKECTETWFKTQNLVTWSYDNRRFESLKIWTTDKKNCLFVQSYEVKPTKNVAIGKWGRPTVGINKLTTGRVANWQRAYQLPCWTQYAVWSWSSEKNTVNSPHLTHSTRRQVVLEAIINTEVLLLSVFPSRSLPDRPSSSKDCKDHGFQPEAFAPW